MLKCLQLHSNWLPTNELGPYPAGEVLYFFKGISYRLQIPLTTNPKPLLDSAMQAQQKAVALEDGAADVHNELGIFISISKTKQKPSSIY